MAQMVKRNLFQKKRRGSRKMKRVKKFSILILLLIGFTLSNCAPVGPNYKKRIPEVPKRWNVRPDSFFKYEISSPDKLADWWKTFNDPELERLEKLAVEGNLNLKIAVKRVEEARLLRGIEKTNLFPTINANGTLLDERSSENSGSGKENRFYEAGIDSSWEIDLFGRIRRKIEAAQANLEATNELLRDVYVSLLSEVALNYVEIRTYQNRLKVLKKNIELQREIYNFNKSLYDSGVINEVPLKQSAYELEELKSNIHPLESALEVAKNRLAILLGKKPGFLSAELKDYREIPAPPTKILVSIPIETLKNRPDVREAERELAYETALIGVKKADLYPTFSLSGIFNFNSINVGDIFKWGSRSWSIGPSIFWKIFNRGAIKKSVLMQTAKQKEALYNFQATVLKALGEVENAMISYDKELEHIKDLEKAHTAALNLFTVAEDNYKSGVGNFIDVLDAKRSLQSIEDQIVQSKGMLVSDLIKLYKALGGGWQSLKLKGKK